MFQEERLSSIPGLKKAPTGIPGLDEILRGGLPAGRTTLICGGPGCGKTTLAMEFLVRGAREFGEPGLFISFEETKEDLVENFRSLGFDLEGLIAEKKLKIIYVAITKEEIVEAGMFSLDALLIRIQQGLSEVGAKRIVLDTMETIFSALGQTETLRTEIARLLHLLREKEVATVVTGERGKEELTRRGFEEYISDCVILLDHRIAGQTSRRRLRIVKYRGSGHSADEYPFMIASRGFSVLPISSLNLDYKAHVERVSTGVEDIDEMLEGKGYYKATTVLVTGRSGTGKSSLAAAFALAACERGEHVLYFAFEESSAQIVRNMRSLGFDLDPWVESGDLTIRAFRPSFRGLEEHLVAIAQEAQRVKPMCVVIDPATNFVTGGGVEEVKSMLTRILDILKRQGCTVFMTGLTAGSGISVEAEVYISSLVDTWMSLDVERTDGLSRRTILIVKSRGMKHSQDTHELLMSSQGFAVRGLASRSENGSWDHGL
jgi:circadian clock protein KaiC